MKTVLISFTLLVMSFLCHAQNGKVVLHVEGILQKSGGEISAGIFFEQEFPNVGKQLVGKEVNVDGSVMNIVFENVPPGEYGVAVFQDIDQDRKLKTNFIGLPQEPIGFSNDARIKFGPPSFADARILVEANKEIQLKITLR